jgi:hypothetical protein
MGIRLDAAVDRSFQESVPTLQAGRLPDKDTVIETVKLPF